MDLSNLVIQISTNGADQAIQQIDNVKSAGKAAAAQPIDVKITSIGADKAIEEFHKLRIAGVNASSMKIDAKSPAEFAETVKKMNDAMARSPFVVDSVTVSAAGLTTTIKKVPPEVEKLSSTLNSLTGTPKSTIKDINDHFLRMARIVASVAIAFYLVRGAINVFQELLNTVDEFNTTTIGIASTMTDMAKDQSDPYKNFTQNLAYAQDMYVQLENSANKFYASGQELIQAWNILTQQGIVLQGSQIDNLGTIVDKIKLLTQGQVSSVQIAQELRAALMGQARPTDQLARIVKDRLGGAWKEVFQQIKETQSLEPLAKMFSGLEIARPFIQETMMSQLTTLWTNLRQTTRMGMADPYKDVVQSLKEWNEWLKENKVEVGERIAGAWNNVKIVLSAIEDIIKHIAVLIHDPIWMTVLGVLVGGLAGGPWGAAIGGGAGFLMSTGTVAGAVRANAMPSGKEYSPANPKESDPFIMMLDEIIEVQKRKKELDKELSNVGVGFWTSIFKALQGDMEGANKAAIQYEEITNRVMNPNKAVVAPQATEMVQQPHLWDDASIKALQTASTLVVSFNHELSNISGNSIDKIVSDMAKMNDQIDKTIFKMRKEAETKELAISYEKQLYAIRDRVIAQELERRNREIYSYSLEGVPDTLSNQFAKIQFSSEEFWRKFGDASKGAMSELSGDPILRMVEQAKTAEKTMSDAGRNWGEVWKDQLNKINSSLDQTIDKLVKIGKIPPVAQDYSKMNLYTSTSGEYLKEYRNKSLSDYSRTNQEMLDRISSNVSSGVSGTVSQYTAQFQKSAEEYTKAIEGVTKATDTAAKGMDSSFKIVFSNPEKDRIASSLNNPGLLTGKGPNEVYPYQANLGATATGGKFLSFPSPEAGFEAVVKQLEIYRDKYDLTIAGLIEKYAPKNDGKNYEVNPSRIAQISTFFGGTPDTKMSQLDIGKLAQLIIQQESQAKVVGTFTGLQASADTKRKEMLGGQTDQEMETAKKMNLLKLAILQTGLKLTENERSYYAILAGMNIPVEQQNEYSQKALDLELDINRAKTIQFISANGLNEVDKSRLLQLDSTVAAEKKKTEAINQQLRPLEAQKNILSQFNKFYSSMGSNAPLLKDQLVFQEQSLAIQQRIDQIDLVSFLEKNRDLTDNDKERLLVLQGQSQAYERMQLQMKKWQGEGLFGGMSMWSMDRVNKAFSELSNAVKSLMNDLESTISSGISDQIINYFTTGKFDTKAIMQNVVKLFIQKGVELQVGQMFGGLAALWQKVTGQESLGGESSATKSASIIKQGSDEAGQIWLSYVMRSMDYFKGAIPGSAGGLGGGGLGAGGFKGFQGIDWSKSMQESSGGGSAGGVGGFGGGGGEASGGQGKFADQFGDSIKNFNQATGNWNSTGDFWKNDVGSTNKSAGNIGIMSGMQMGLSAAGMGLAAIGVMTGSQGLQTAGMVLMMAATALQIAAMVMKLFHSGGMIMHSGGHIPWIYAHGGMNLKSDEIPIIAQRGEYMISRKGVRAAGVPLLNAINSGNVSMGGESGSEKPFIYSPTYHINAIDAKGVDKVLEKHGRTIAKTLKGQYRNNYTIN